MGPVTGLKYLCSINRNTTTESSISAWQCKGLLNGPMLLGGPPSNPKWTTTLKAQKMSLCGWYSYIISGSNDVEEPGQKNESTTFREVEVKMNYCWWVSNMYGGMDTTIHFLSTWETCVCPNAKISLASTHFLLLFFSWDISSCKKNSFP